MTGKEASMAALENISQQAYSGYTKEIVRADMDRIAGYMRPLGRICTSDAPDSVKVTMHAVHDLDMARRESVKLGCMTLSPDAEPETRAIVTSDCEALALYEEALFAGATPAELKAIAQVQAFVAIQRAELHI